MQFRGNGLAFLSNLVLPLSASIPTASSPYAQASSNPEVPGRHYGTSLGATALLWPQGPRAGRQRVEGHVCFASTFK